MTIEQLVEEINKKEVSLWKNPISLEYKAPYFRFSDIDYILMQEIYAQSRKKFVKEQVISFVPAKKDELNAAVNNLRIMLANQKIIIHPRCKTLLRHLKNVRWDKQKKKFARSQDNGHFDAVAALIYFVRNVQYTKNPYPQHYNLTMQTLPLYLKDPAGFQNPINSQVEVLKKLFNSRSPRKKY